MLALSLTPVQYQQNDLIIKKGDLASEMFFVVRGVAEVFNEEDGQVFAQFTPGSFFGEVGLFFDIKRTASVHCITDVVDVFKLTREVLDKVLENYPEVSQKIKNEAKQRFLYNQEREKIKLSQRKRVQTEHEVIREKLKSVSVYNED
jgi:CRP-like cAMP-binding protein